MNRTLSTAIALLGLVLTPNLNMAEHIALSQPFVLADSSVKMGNYSIQPLQGYHFKPIPNVPSPAYGYAFLGPSRADGTSGQLVLVYLPLSSAKSRDVDVLLHTRLNAIRQYYSDWLQSGLEIVTTKNGLSFHRIRWVGTHQKQRLVMQGFLYVTIHENEVIYLSSQDLALYQSDLNRANSAVMTFSHGTKKE